RDALESRTLSLAHILPRCLGGNLCTLTCEQCNSRFGHELEAHLFRRLDHSAKISGDRQIPRAWMKGPFGKVGVELRLPKAIGDEISVFLIEKRSNPNDVASLRAFLEQMKNTSAPPSNENPQLEFSFSSRFENKRGKLALFHAAYLAGFHFFG